MFVFCYTTVSVRPGDGGPRKVQHHLTRARSAWEARIVTRQGRRQSSALVSVRQGRTVTTDTVNAVCVRLGGGVRWRAQSRWMDVKSVEEARTATPQVLQRRSALVCAHPGRTVMTGTHNARIAAKASTSASRIVPCARLAPQR